MEYNCAERHQLIERLQIKEKIPELPLDDTVLEDIMKQIYDKK